MTTASAKYDPASFPPFAVTVDLVVLTIREGALHVLVIERGLAPFKGCVALPGGFVKPDEDLDTAARRELLEETQVHASFLEQIDAFGAPSRDPRMRVVSVAYLCFTPLTDVPVGGSDAAKAFFAPVDSLLADEAAMAFDHRQILRAGVEKARGKLEYTTLATAFCPEEFTISDLRRVYEVTWGIELEPANFRRKVDQCADFVVPTGRKRNPGPEGGKPAGLFVAGTATSLRPPLYRETNSRG